MWYRPITIHYAGERDVWKRVLAAAGLVLVLIQVLAACSSGESGAPPSAPALSGSPSSSAPTGSPASSTLAAPASSAPPSSPSSSPSPSPSTSSSSPPPPPRTSPAPPPTRAAPPPTTAAPRPTTAPSAWCTATASVYYAPDDENNVYVHSNQPYTDATASGGGHSWSYETNGSGYAVIYLNGPPAGTPITVTVGGATCTATWT
jgi:hypothetical protein